MRVHRFHTGAKLQLKKDFWVRDEALLWQWGKVLRFRVDQEVILFDGVSTERLYRITEISKTEAHLELITEIARKLPKRHVYLFWSLLKRDNNDIVLQKCTELGVTTFVPLLTERSVRDNFSHDRALKIVSEASEQCGRSDIPSVREPMRLSTALDEYSEKVQIMVCQQGSGNVSVSGERLGVLIGPEGGWSDVEKDLFVERKLEHILLSDFTLRAETAAISAVGRLL